MPRLRKTAYLTSQARLANELAATQSALATMARLYAGKPIAPEVSDAWNALHDYVWDIERAQRDLEHTWETRDWGHADWTAHQLILMNID